MTHPHGHYLRYLHGPDEEGADRGCRCAPCREDARLHHIAYRRRRDRESWGDLPSTMVDAEPVRAHVQGLMAAGVPWKTVADLAGVGSGGVGRLLYGKGERPPTVRMTRRVANKLLAVRAADALTVDGYVDASGTMRRIRALVAVGWNMSEIARRLEMNPSAMGRFTQCKRVRADRALRVRDLYGELWNARPPEATPMQRRDADAARRMAARKGWPPPAAWDDDLIDLPEADLVAALDRMAAAMDDDELAACHTAKYKHGDISPLTAAAVREQRRRRHARELVREPARERKTA